MSKRRFTVAETLALCFLLIALLVAAISSRGCRDSGEAGRIAADSVWRVRADSVDALIERARAEADSIRADKERKADSIARSRKHAKRPKATPAQPVERRHLDEPLSAEIPQ